MKQEKAQFETAAIREIAQFAAEYAHADNPLSGVLEESDALRLASAYFVAWSAWGKPLDTNHKAVAALLYGDRPSPPALLAQAIQATLDANEPAWRTCWTMAS